MRYTIPLYIFKGVRMATHQIQMGEWTSAEAPDAIYAGGVESCAFIGLLNTASRNIYLGHFALVAGRETVSRGTSPQEMIEGALDEAANRNDLTTWAGGVSMPTRAEALNYDEEKRIQQSVR